MVIDSDVNSRTLTVVDTRTSPFACIWVNVFQEVEKDSGWNRLINFELNFIDNRSRSPHLCTYHSNGQRLSIWQM